MRETGFLGLLGVIYECARDGFGTARAWTVITVILAILAAPFALVALIVWLFVWLAA